MIISRPRTDTQYARNLSCDSASKITYVYPPIESRLSLEVLLQPNSERAHPSSPSITLHARALIRDRYMYIECCEKSPNNTPWRSSLLIRKAAVRWSPATGISRRSTIWPAFANVSAGTGQLEILAGSDKSISFVLKFPRRKNSQQRVRLYVEVVFKTDEARELGCMKSLASDFRYATLPSRTMGSPSFANDKNVLSLFVKVRNG